MAKGKFALFALLLAGSVITTSPANSQTFYFDDGCAVLNDVVRRSLLPDIVQDELYPTDYYRPHVGGLRSCSNTTAAVSAAFRASMMQMNLRIRWNLTQPDGGSVCLNHDLSFCYPFPDPMGPILKPSDQTFIHNRWLTVRNGVISRMPRGAASNMTYFDVTALSENLRSSTSGPLAVNVGSIGSLR